MLKGAPDCVHTFQASYQHPICKTSIKTDNLNANMSVTTGFLLYACLKENGYVVSNVVVTIADKFYVYCRKLSRPNFWEVQVF